jgi:hypothetical protein
MSFIRTQSDELQFFFPIAESVEPYEAMIKLHLRYEHPKYFQNPVVRRAVEEKLKREMPQKRKFAKPFEEALAGADPEDVLFSYGDHGPKIRPLSPLAPIYELVASGEITTWKIVVSAVSLCLAIAAVRICMAVFSVDFYVVTDLLIFIVGTLLLVKDAQLYYARTCPKIRYRLTEGGELVELFNCAVRNLNRLQTKGHKWCFGTENFRTKSQGEGITLTAYRDFQPFFTIRRRIILHCHVSSTADSYMKMIICWIEIESPFFLAHSLIQAAISARTQLLEELFVGEAKLSIVPEGYSYTPNFSTYGLEPEGGLWELPNF